MSRRRNLKKIGKQLAQEKSAEIREQLAKRNPWPVGHPNWVSNLQADRTESMRIMKKHYVQTLKILIPCLLIGCSTPENKVDQGVPQPLWKITKQDMDAIILKQWAPTKKEVFRTSSFSEGEIHDILTNFAVDRAMADHFGYKSEALGDCLTINLLEIKVVDSSKVDGSTNEIWEVDLCSLRASFPISLTADKRNWIKAHSDANTRPNDFTDLVK